MKDPQILIVTTQPVTIDPTTFLNQVTTLITAINKHTNEFDLFAQAFVTLAEGVLTRLAVCPEQPIYIYYASYRQIDTNDVLTVDLSKPAFNGISLLAQKSATTAKVVFTPPVSGLFPYIYEVDAVAPAMDVLEDASNCLFDAILMWMKIQIVASIKKQPQSSDPYGFPVLLPEPAVDKVQVTPGSSGYQKLVIGMHGDDLTDHLGKIKANDYIRGDARWYSLAVWENHRLGDLASFNFNAIDASINTGNNKCLCLPSLVITAARAVRLLGEKIVITGPNWTDDTITCQIKNEPGFVIVWRDDIPSKAIPLLENLADDILEMLANDIWYWSSLGGKQSTTSLPWPACEAILLGASQVETTLNNFLYKWLKSGDITVNFGFVVGRPAGSHFDVDHDISADAALGKVADDLTGYTRQMFYDLKLDIYKTAPVDINNQPLDDNKQTLPTKIYCLPDILSEIASITPPNRDFQIQMTAQITFPRLTKNPVVVRLGPLFTFHPTPLYIPTLAVFFRDIDFQGPPLVMLPVNTPWLPSGIWSLGSNATQLDQLRSTVCDKVSDVKKALDILSFFWTNKSLNMIRIAIGTIDACLSAIICTTGCAADLTQSQWQCDSDGSVFNDKASSLILIGPPHDINNLTVTCYVDINYSNTEVRFKIPSGSFFAAIHDFDNIRESCKVTAPDGTIIYIPTPVVDVVNGILGENDGTVNCDFDDSMSSVTIG